MLKTTCKTALERIRAYVLYHTDTEGYEEFNEPETFTEAALAVYSEFRRAKSYEFKRFGVNEFEVFADWCAGLPSILDTCYYYNRSAVDDLAEILDETEAEKSKFTESQAERQLTWLIYREIMKEVRKHGEI